MAAEGARYSSAGLGSYLEEEHAQLGFELRVTILGHVQRGGAPGAFDRLLGIRLGATATERLAAGEHGVLVGLRGGEGASTPFGCEREHFVFAAFHAGMK